MRQTTKPVPQNAGSYVSHMHASSSQCVVVLVSFRQMKRTSSHILALLCCVCCTCACFSAALVTCQCHSFLSSCASSVHLSVSTVLCISEHTMSCFCSFVSFFSFFSLHVQVAMLPCTVMPSMLLIFPCLSFVFLCSSFPFYSSLSFMSFILFICLFFSGVLP